MRRDGLLQDKDKQIWKTTDAGTDGSMELPET